MKLWWQKNNASLTLTITSLPSLACRLKCTISGLNPVSICLYIWWHVSISSTARSMWSPGRPLWAPSAKVPGRKHTRWSCRVTRQGEAQSGGGMMKDNDEGRNWLDRLTEIQTNFTVTHSAKAQRRIDFTRPAAVASLSFGSVWNTLWQSTALVLCVVLPLTQQPMEYKVQM